MVEPIVCMNCGRPLSNIYEAFNAMLANIPVPAENDLSMGKELKDIYYIFGFSPADYHCTMTLMTTVKHSDFIRDRK